MGHLQQFHQEAIRLKREIGRVDVAHMRPELRVEPDALPKEAVDARPDR